MVLGRYLGPATDMGPAMTARILKQNGRLVHRLTYRHLMPQEIESEEEKKKREDFTKHVNDKVGSPLTSQDLHDFNDKAVTPAFEMYSDDTEIARNTKDIDDVTPEDVGQYVGAEVQLPK